MGKKYIVEIGRLERLYKAFIDAHGKPEITWLSPEVDLTPYTEPDMEQVRKEAYDNGYETAKHECEDCNTNIVVEAIRKKAYEKAYERGRKDGKIEGQAETWVCVKKIAFNPESVECVDDLVRMGFDVGTADSWSEAIELLFEKYSASECIEKIRQYEQEKDRQARIEYNFDEIKDVLETTAKEAIPHRNYQYLSDYWCECGWHLGKKGDVKFCADCGRRIKWD